MEEKKERKSVERERREKRMKKGKSRMHFDPEEKSRSKEEEPRCDSEKVGSSSSKEMRLGMLFKYAICLGFASVCLLCCLSLTLPQFL